MTGSLILLGNTPVLWRSKKQSIVASSTAEAEYIALAKTAQDVCWIRNLMTYLDELPKEATTLFDDNQAAISIAKENAVTEANKHIDLKYHQVRDKIKRDIIKLEYCPTCDQKADFLTKSLGFTKLESMIKSLNLY